MNESANEPYQPIPLRDDALQWEFDRAVKETGRAEHFFGARKLPATVRTYAMISKHVGRPARRLERLADIEADAGHERTALELYLDAANMFAEAQHAIFESNDEKKLLHAASVRCYDRARELAPTPVSRIHVPWQDSYLTGYFHQAPVAGRAPLVVMVIGCDQTKERISPLNNWAGQRGMHLFVFDGPGQGDANLRGIALTRDNYEEATNAVLSHLLTLPEVDADRVGLFSFSFGSYWAARIAATDHRYAAHVLQWASVADKRLLFGGAVSPRYKQLFAYLTRAGSEAELDAFIDGMTLTGLVGQIRSPTLLTVGEFDPRSPLDQVLAFFDDLAAPSELWIFGDQQHMVSVRGASGLQLAGSVDSHSVSMDWLRDRLDGRPQERAGQVLYVEPGDLGPNDPNVSLKRHWYE